MDAFIWPSAEMTECWMVCSNVTIKKTASYSQDSLRVMHVRFFSWNGLVLDHPVPVVTMASGWYYCLLLQYRVRLALHCKQLELLEHGHFVPGQCNTSSCLCCAKSGSMLGWRGVGTSSLLSRSCSYVITGYLHVWENVCGEKGMSCKSISMITELKMTVYNIVGKVCGQCWCSH
jgi:hypothetical protein